jgi:hypothetical protein
MHQGQTIGGRPLFPTAMDLQRLAVNHTTMAVVCRAPMM